MARGHPHRPAPGRLLLIAAAVAGMVVLVFVVLPALRPDPGPGFPPVGPLDPPHPPIAAEADVYRSGPWSLAVDLAVGPRAAAIPRTPEQFRQRRAYPGAPPRIPHGLTEGEFLTTRCNSCHERGGFVPRFSAYAPVTPHPEWSQCLQCHAPDAMTVGLGIPELTTDVICGQCHVNPDQPPPTLVALDWIPMAWPATGLQAMEGSPPGIPHELDIRGNCLACHGGPSALRGLRTTHPERIDCRSCHVPASPGIRGGPGAQIPGEAPAPGEVFTRPLDRSTPTPSGGDS
jgi:nitrate reductase (cytochrome), electron transfer subunit